MAHQYPDCKRVARTLREAFDQPGDWFEGPDAVGLPRHVWWLIGCIVVALLITSGYVLWTM